MTSKDISNAKFAWAREVIDARKHLLDTIENPQVHEHADSGLVQYLLADCAMHSLGQFGAHAGTNGWKYACPSRWILEHGRLWTYQALDSDTAKEYGIDTGPIKMCYDNSYHAACNDPDGIVYCEGYAWAIIPMAHAWNTFAEEPQPNMVDLTLRVHNIETPVYFGVPFRQEYVEHVLDGKDEHGVIANWQQDYPLLQNDDWLEEAIHVL